MPIEFWFLKKANGLMPEFSSSRRTPKSFVGTHYSRSQRYCVFGELPKIDLARPITEKLLVEATLNGCYGPRKDWAASMHFSAAIRRKALADLKGNHSQLRRYLVLSGRSLQVDPSYNVLTSDRKGSFSRDLGFVAAYIATKLWLETSGSGGIRSYLNISFFASAIQARHPGRPVAMFGTSLPDIVVQDNRLDWRAVKAKGGAGHLGRDH